VRKILLWHRGALGDVLLSGPALQGIGAKYPEARFTLVGSPTRLALLAATLPIEAIWDSQQAQWAYLFMPDSPLPRKLRQMLAKFDLAVIFSPEERLEVNNRLQEAGINEVLWIPTFPRQSRVPVGQFQAQHLAEWGIQIPPDLFRLILPPAEHNAAWRWFKAREGVGPDQPPWVALAPGSGHPRKNWPLEYYQELARRLQKECRARLLWIAGPVEEELAPELAAISQEPGHYLLFNLPLPTVAARLGLCQLYIGGDSGITHLAAAIGGLAVLALFGPTDPQIWAPLGEQVMILSSPMECAPCTAGREISCPEARCLEQMEVEKVFAAAQATLAGVCARSA
jgi:ADP-heptose:LPS heptosyltransferase